MTKPPVTDLDKLVGNRLKMLRQQHKLSASALADFLDTSQQQVSRYERGLNRLSGVLLWQLAGYFGVPMSWFFLDLQEQQPASPFVHENRPSYEATVSHDQLTILTRAWPTLGALQRDAILRMLDTFLRLQ